MAQDTTLKGTLPSLPQEEDQLLNFKKALRQVVLHTQAQTTPTVGAELGRYAQAGVKLTTPSAISTALQMGTVGRRQVQQAAMADITDLLKLQEQRLADRKQSDLQFARDIFASTVGKSAEYLTLFTAEDFESIKNGVVPVELMQRIGAAAPQIEAKKKASGSSGGGGGGNNDFDVGGLDVEPELPPDVLTFDDFISQVYIPKIGEQSARSPDVNNPQVQQEIQAFYAEYKASMMQQAKGSVKEQTESKLSALAREVQKNPLAFKSLTDSKKTKLINEYVNAGIDTGFLFLEKPTTITTSDGKELTPGQKKFLGK